MLSLLLFSSANASGGCASGGCEEDAGKLHLNGGEKARFGPGWGAGLIETTLEVDVFVAGGGSAGTSAALAASRNGMNTVLVEGRAVLGGNSGSEIRVTMVGACGGGERAGNAMELDCREGGIVEEYVSYSSTRHY